MPSRRFTSGRKFSTTTSAFLTMRLNAAKAAGALRLSVMLRLLRCRFWKSDPSRGPPSGSPPPGSGGNSILMTLAPQSASWRTQVGPARTRVRSRTVNRSSAREALGNGIFRHLRGVVSSALLSSGAAPGDPTFPDIPPVVYRGGDLSRQGSIRYGAAAGGAATSIGRRDDHAHADPLQAHPRAAGAGSRRRRHDRERAGVPPAGAARRAASERTAARGTTTGRRTRERVAAVAGGLGDRARRRDSRRHADLYRDGGNALALRSIGRALGRGLLHRLRRQERRGYEPSRHLRLQRRTGRGIGLSELGLGRPAHSGVSR